MDTVADILPRKKRIDNRAALSRAACGNTNSQIIEPDCILRTANFKAFAASTIFVFTNSAYSSGVFSTMKL